MCEVGFSMPMKDLKVNHLIFKASTIALLSTDKTRHNEEAFMSVKAK